MVKVSKSSVSALFDKLEFENYKIMNDYCSP